MERIDMRDLNDNVFETIGKEWMLVTAGNEEKFNMMTASWGCLGWLWNKPVAVVFIRPERYTHQFIEENDTLTLQFLGNSEKARLAYNFCGSKSGRDFDKAHEAGLTPVTLEGGEVTFEEARLTLVCRHHNQDTPKEENMIDNPLPQSYGAKHGGYHDVYVLEITEALRK